MPMDRQNILAQLLAMAPQLSRPTAGIPEPGGRDMMNAMPPTTGMPGPGGRENMNAMPSPLAMALAQSQQMGPGSMADDTYDFAPHPERDALKAKRMRQMMQMMDMQDQGI